MQSKQGYQYASALAQAKQGYSKGISYYQMQQNKFNKLMRIAERDSLTIGYRNFAQKMNEQLAQQSIESVLSSNNLKKFEQAVGQLSQQVIANERINIHQIMDSNKGRTNINSKNYLKNYANRTKEALMSEVINGAYRAEILSLYKTIFGRGNITDQPTINALYGFLRRQIIADMTYAKMGKKIENSLSGYTSVFLGDFREDFGVAAFNSLYQNIAQRAGDITDLRGVQTSVDIIIGPNAAQLDRDQLTKIVQRLEKLNTSTEIEIPQLETEQFFSAQVKSWSVPESAVPSDRAYRSVGTRAELHHRYGFDKGGPDDVDFARGWHNSASVLSKNITQVLGRSNIFYIANNKFYWTSDLIQTFKNANYFLTFYYKRHTNQQTRDYEFTYPSTTDVVWQKQMYKNMYKLKRKK